MSISRTADTIAVSNESGQATATATRLTNGRVAFGTRTLSAAEALETALALVTAATGTVVQRSVTAGAVAPSYDIFCGQSIVNLNPAGVSDHPGYYGAWAVGDILSLLGAEAFRGMAGEKDEKLARQFPFLTDDQAREILSYLGY